MAGGAQRLTNGQRACICGLVIAGLSMTEACKIAGVPRDRYAELLPPNWHKRTRKAIRWKADQLAELREAYCDHAQRTKTIAERYGVTAGQITNLAKKNGWPMRPAGHKRKPNSIRSMTPRQRTLYFKLRHDAGMPALSAAAEALR